jgi:hypothetical protein
MAMTMLARLSFLNPGASTIGRVSKMMMLKIQVMNVQFDDRIVHHFAL